MPSCSCWPPCCPPRCTPPNATPPPRRGAPAVSEEAPRRPPSALGMPTPATLGNRMGNTFGVSAFPQRP
ncbi:hypothetical protein CBR71_19005 [Bordetella hinzii]|nr:hypothetical protein CBR70_18750 [Bordetella hinzii]QDJ47752.1 hypothetical protein CBR71_19005 [Bordetella hinzii]